MPWASVEGVNYINSPRAISTRQLHAKHGVLPLMEGEDERHGLVGPRTALDLGARRFRPRRAGDVLAARAVSFGLGVTTLPRFRCTVDRPGSSGF